MKSDGGSSIDSPMGSTSDVTVPRDILVSMSDYMGVIDNLLASNSLWDKACGQINAGGEGEKQHCTMYEGRSKSFAIQYDRLNVDKFKLSQMLTTLMSSVV